jgi:exopolysaccharide biosynthesis protein
MGYKRYRWYGSTVHVYEFNQKTNEIFLDSGVKGKLEPLSKLCPNSLAKINCGFFNFNASSEHLGTWSPNWTTVTYDDNGDQLLKFYDPETMTRECIESIRKNITLEMGASFTLVEDGKISIRNTDPFPHWKQRHPRTVLAQNKNRNICFIVADGRKWNEAGWTAQHAALFCTKVLPCRCAVNLDGGGSSEMIVGTKIVSRPSDGGERYIGTALGCKLK